MPEPAEENAPSTVERLAAFIEQRLADRGDVLEEVHGGGDESDHEAVLALAADVLQGFFRVEDATSIYAVPIIELRSGEPRVQTHWGPMIGYLRTEEARAMGTAFLETAETAEIEASLYTWLLKDPGSDDAGAARIINSWRAYRLEQQEAADPAAG